MKEKLKGRLFGIIITSISLVGSIAFLALIINTGLLTVTLILVSAILLAILTAGIFLLAQNSENKVRSAIGVGLAAILLIIEAVSGYYIAVGAAALSHISKPTVEFIEMGIYVRKDDPAKTVEDIKDYSFGILELQDRENTDLALKELEKSYAFTPKTSECDGLEGMMDALFAQTISAVVINTAFLDLLEEIEGHEEDLLKIKELCIIHIEKDAVHIENNEVSAMDKKVFTVYISGIDTFGKISKRSRSDVNILATVNVETGEILLVNTPRDYYVPLSISNGIPDKLTHAGIYGIDVSMDTIGMLYDTEIDYYFRVNFDGFKKIIDALGGITVHSNYEFKVNDYSFVKGENFLDGQGALHFARARKPVPGGDHTRGKHQMEVIKGVVNKMTSPSILLGYGELLEGIKDSFETSIPYDKISGLVRNQIKNGTKWNVTSYAVSGKGASRKTYSQSLKAYVMIPDEATVEKAKALIKQVKQGEKPTV